MWDSHSFWGPNGIKQDEIFWPKKQFKPKSGSNNVQELTKIRKHATGSSQSNPEGGMFLKTNYRVYVIKSEA